MLLLGTGRLWRLLTVIGLLMEAGAVGAEEGKETFDEELIIKPLPHGGVYAHFQFTTRRTQSDTVHHNVFPKTMSDIVQSNSVNELHVSLTQGRWHYHKWGYPIVSAPMGGEVWAWFNDDVTDVSQSWQGVTSSLSGLLCASFNFIQPENTAEPCLVMGRYVDKNRTQTIQDCLHGNTTLRYSSLPNENVCTENLTPWVKLLPCRSTSGLAQLLIGPKVFSSSYTSLGLVIRPYCMDAQCSVLGQEMVITASIVFDWPKGEAYSLSTLFGANDVTACSVASSSTLYVPSQTSHTFTPSSPPFTIYGYEGGVSYNAYDVLSLLGSSQPKVALTVSPLPLDDIKNEPIVFHMTRHLIGYAQQEGTAVVTLHNHGNATLLVTHLQTIPWFVRVYGHTVKVTIDGERRDDVIRHSRFVPSIDRKRPMTLEIVLALPPTSQSHLSFTFHHTFIRIKEHRPDPNRGFDIGAGIAEVLLPANQNPLGNLDWSPKLYHRGPTNQHQAVMTRVYTPIALVAMPLPDFSMPYNVITLTCTIMALCFGLVFYHTTTFVTIRTSKKPSLLMTLYHSLRGNPTVEAPKAPEPMHSQEDHSNQ